MEVREAEEVKVSLEVTLPGAIAQADADADADTDVGLPSWPDRLIYQWPGPLTPISS